MSTIDSTIAAFAVTLGDAFQAYEAVVAAQTVAANDAAAAAAAAVIAAEAAEASVDAAVDGAMIDVQDKEIVDIAVGETLVLTADKVHYLSNTVFRLNGVRAVGLVAIDVAAGAKVDEINVIMSGGTDADNVVRIRTGATVGNIKIEAPSYLPRRAGANGAVYAENATDWRIGNVEVYNIARGMSFVNCRRFHVGNVYIKQADRGVHVLDSSVFTFGNIFVNGIPGTFTIAPGRSAMHVGDCQDGQFGNVKIYRSVEHGIYCSGADTGIARLSFGDVSIFEAGQSGVKIKASVKGSEDEDGDGIRDLSGQPCRDVSFGAIHVAECGLHRATTNPGRNSSGLRLERVRGFSCPQLSVKRSSSSSATSSCQEGLLINSSSDVQIGSVLVDKAEFEGIRVLLTRGDLARCYIGNLVVNKTPTGIKMDCANTDGSTYAFFDVIGGRVTECSTAVLNYVGSTVYSLGGTVSRIKLDYVLDGGSVKVDPSADNRLRTGFTNVNNF